MTQPPVDPPPPGGQQPPPPGDQTPPPTYESHWPVQPPPPAPPPRYDATPQTNYPAHWNQQNLAPVYVETPRGGTNGFAIAALVFGIIPICFLGVIFGIVALVQTSKSGQKGKALAITGLVLNVLWVVGFTTVAVVNGLNTADRDATGTIKSAGRLHVYDLKVGDCFDDEAAESELKSNVPAVPCTEPHSAEVFAVVRASGASYPGDDTIDKQAQTVCTSRMNAVDSDRVPSDAELHWFRPTESYWRLNHRNIACLVVTQTTHRGSLLK